MRKISAMLRGEDASQPMILLSNYNSFTCDAISSNYKIHLYVRLCEANGYINIHLELDIVIEYYALYNYIHSSTIP